VRIGVRIGVAAAAAGSLRIMGGRGTATTRPGPGAGCDGAANTTVIIPRVDSRRVIGFIFMKGLIWGWGREILILGGCWGRLGGRRMELWVLELL